LEEDLAGAEETASAAALPSSAAWWKKWQKPWENIGTGWWFGT